SPDKVNMIKVFEKLLDFFINIRKTANISTEIYINGGKLKDGDSFILRGERILLESLFGNLLKNAMEASPEGGKVTVYLDNADNHNIIRIHNHGVIPDHVQERFFERYVTSKKNGTGIGTYSAYLITKTHGGMISFQSNKSDGTTLKVILP
ncbi:MAG: ATP-binding protein, partial [Spirochaetota bacterium]|nr:ATP-binding protein [Spirochaetota bacterium]